MTAGGGPVGTDDSDRLAAGQSAIDQLVENWDVMSAHYLEGRAGFIDRLVGYLSDRFASGNVTICELGCGPGTLLTRLAAALPSARLVNVEIDPVLRRLHALGPANAGPGRIEIVDADLTDPGWVHSVGIAESIDAVIAVQMMHYLPPARFVEMLAEVRSLLAPDGVFVHLDRVRVDRVGVDRVGAHDDTAGRATEWRPASADPWADWWRTARLTPALADAVRERDRRSGIASAEYHPDEPALRSLLAAAGLATLLAQERVGASLLTVAGRAG